MKRGDADHLWMALGMYVVITLSILLSACDVEPARQQIISQPLPASTRNVRVRIPYQTKTTYPFTLHDRYSSTDEACAGEVARLIVDHRRREPIMRWCQKRAWFASRNRKVVSKVDGSAIHDVDRWVGHIAYGKAVRLGWIVLEECQHLVIDEAARHDRRGRRMARKFRDKSKADAWMRSSHDYERFASRGYWDTIAAWAYRYVPGCYPPEELDRFDVGAEVFVRRADRICDDLEKVGLQCTVKNLKEVW